MSNDLWFGYICLQIHYRINCLLEGVQCIKRTQHLNTGTAVFFFLLTLSYHNCRIGKKYCLKSSCPNELFNYFIYYLYLYFGNRVWINKQFIYVTYIKHYKSILLILQKKQVSQRNLLLELQWKHLSFLECNTLQNCKHLFNCYLINN